MRLAECDACAVCIPIPMALVRRASVSDGNMNITRPVDRIGSDAVHAAPFPL